MFYNHELINKMREDYNNDWTKIIDEYSKVTGETINRENIIGSHSKWRRKNKPARFRHIYNHELISDLVELHNNWDLVHKEYCKEMKVDINWIKFTEFESGLLSH